MKNRICEIIAVERKVLFLFFHRAPLETPYYRVSPGRRFKPKERIFNNINKEKYIATIAILYVDFNADFDNLAKGKRKIIGCFGVCEFVKFLPKFSQFSGVEVILHD